MRRLENMTLENLRCEAGRPRRTQSRFAGRLSGLFPADENNSEKGQPKARFRMDSIAPANKPAPPKSSMRVLLRNIKTMKFLGFGERWTKDAKQARDFRNGWWATIHAFTVNPRHLVIHYEFDDDRYDLHIPVLGQP
jgi:hypothetical protein